MCAALALDPELRRRCREAAAVELEAMADLLDTEPMGLQLSLLPGAAPTTSCMVLRQRDRATLAINPFRPDGAPGANSGVALVTSAPEGVAMHQRVVESMWRESVKGAAAANRIRALLAAHRVR